MSSTVQSWRQRGGVGRLLAAEVKVTGQRHPARALAPAWLWRGRVEPPDPRGAALGPATGLSQGNEGEKRT